MTTNRLSLADLDSLVLLDGSHREGCGEYCIIEPCSGGCDGVLTPYADSDDPCLVCGGGDVARVLVERAFRLLDKHTVRAAADDCWMWDGAVWPSGYGVVRAYRHGVTLSVAAHRLALLRIGARVPANMDACHRCDVRLCVNPAHLFTGTRRENMQDCVAKGRLKKPRGESHWCAKLSAADVSAIRERVAAGETQASLALRFGVHSATISRIARRAWRKEVA